MRKRKIESRMLDAVRDRHNWRSEWHAASQAPTTEVIMHHAAPGGVLQDTPSFAEVKLFGHIIARWFYATDTLVIGDAGYRSLTTKNRLNVLLRLFDETVATGAPEWTADGRPWTLGLYQRKGDWFLVVPGHPDMEWHGHARITRETNYWAGWRVTHTAPEGAAAH